MILWKRFLSSSSNLQQRASHVDGELVLQRAIDSLKKCILAKEQHLESTRSKVKDQSPEHRPFNTLEISLAALDNTLVDAYGQFLAEAGMALGAIVPRPHTRSPEIERWSVLSSPHVHKTAWTQFERRTHYRIVRFGNLHPDLVSRMIWYSKVHAPPDVQLNWTVNKLITL